MKFSLILLSFAMSALESCSSSPSSSSDIQRLAPGSSRFMSVTGTKGMVVADDRVAAEWGTQILDQGGNAVDAAVATAFAMSVTRPHFASLGGGGFFVYCPHGKECTTIDYREKSPAAIGRDFYLRHVRAGQAPTDLSQNGALASGVPGVTAGLLMALEKYGKLSRSQILKLPIELARRGYRFSGHSEVAALDRWNEMNPEAKRLFGCDAKPCDPGTTIRQPDLAKVLAEIEKHGAAGFYHGWVAHKIIAGLAASGGVMTEADLAAYDAKIRKPLRGHYRGYEIISMPPPSSGGVLLLQLLGYAERAHAAGAFTQGFGSVAEIHAVAHAMGLAFADRAKYLGDSDQFSVPTEQLIAPQYLDHQWKSFSSGHAALPKAPGEPLKEFMKEPEHTTHLSVVDAEGNAVSLTTTVNDNFGSGFVPPGTGIVMNNQMDDFSVQPGLPNMYGLIGSEANAIAPGKRPLSMMTPTIVRDDNGEVRLVLGAQGGPRIASAVFQTILNRYEFGMSLMDAVTSPRVHEQWRPEELRLEVWGFPLEVTTGLTHLGYRLQEMVDVGRIQALERLPSGRVFGAPDPRAEGAAVAQ